MVAKATVLVTGGAGYIGSHTVRQLIRQGYGVVVCDDLSRGHRWAVPDGIPLIVADIADTTALVQAMQLHGVDAVMHFAAVSQVGESMSDPRLYYSNNVAGTVHLLNACMETNVRRFVYSSSAAVYGEPDKVPVDEDSTLKPTSVYGRTKVMVEKMLHDYATAYGLQYAALRYFNAAGADPAGGLGEDHQPETHLIPIAVQAGLGRRGAVQVFGTDYPTADGTCIRDYVHVCDLADAHILALESLASCPEAAYNLGNGSGFSVREVLGSVERVTGRKVPSVVAARRPGDPAVLVASSDRIRRTLGWKPVLADLDVMVETVWQWEQHKLAL